MPIYKGSNTARVWSITLLVLILIFKIRYEITNVLSFFKNAIDHLSYTDTIRSW